MIFLDTNYLVSFYIEDEEHHERALEIDNDIENEEQVISKLVIAETINLLNTKLKIDKEQIEKTYKILKEDYTVLEDSHMYDDALRKTIDYNKRLPFFDFVFMSIMEDLKIKEIVSFDGHFDLNKNIKRIF